MGSAACSHFVRKWSISFSICICYWLRVFLTNKLYRKTQLFLWMAWRFFRKYNAGFSYQHTPQRSSVGERHAWRTVITDGYMLWAVYRETVNMHDKLFIFYMFTFYISELFSRMISSALIGIDIVVQNNRDKLRRYWRYHGGFRHERNLAQLNTYLKQSTKHNT